ncbi:MAG: hypothetical protein JSS09_04365, partial [Verrucomicrobia bacterium]|nr:hypothetical protein [Verrucomicrobiota bacterium]
MFFRLIIVPVFIINFSTSFLLSSCCISDELESIVSVNVNDEEACFSKKTETTSIVATSLQSRFKKISEVKHNSDADYVFLQDSEGQEWIYKQITDPSPDDQIVIVLESFASEIAKITGIPINEARTISANESFECRLFDKYPGSLHRKVPGKCVHSVSAWTNDFDIHQKFRSPFRVARLGPLPSQEIGLRRAVIQNMAKNKDL